MASVEERVIAIIQKEAETVGDAKVTIDSTLEDLQFDSLAAIEMVFEVEEEFDIQITNEAVKELANVRDVVTGVERILSGEENDFGSRADASQGPAS